MFPSRRIQRYQMLLNALLCSWASFIIAFMTLARVFGNYQFFISIIKEDFAYTAFLLVSFPWQSLCLSNSVLTKTLYAWKIVCGHAGLCCGVVLFASTSNKKNHCRGQWWLDCVKLWRRFKFSTLFAHCKWVLCKFINKRLLHIDCYRTMMHCFADCGLLTVSKCLSG